MSLSVRPPVHTLPSYSLTSDLLGFLRCGLQYRYTRLGKMPSSRPVQLWFGQFIHGVLEESYRQIKDGKLPIPPWPEPKTLTDIMARIDRRLAARNIVCWDDESERLGQRRAQAAVEELGPLLFPLINQAEVRVRGARLMPSGTGVPAKADRYEMLGVIDVVTQIELFNPKFKINLFVQLVVNELPSNPPSEFEVIVDYKGMKRPDLNPPATGKPTSTPDAAGAAFDDDQSLWEIYAWQVHTYAHLRSLLTPKPVVAGVLIYLNELFPTKTDFYSLRRAVRENWKDTVVPAKGSEDEKLLLTWKPKTEGEPVPLLSLGFRIKRAVRVIPITEASTKKALNSFDETVGKIEHCRLREENSGKIINSWDKNPSHEPTCEACDSKTYCPDYGKKRKHQPQLPAVKV
jgi:hypothetical protein